VTDLFEHAALTQAERYAEAEAAMEAGIAQADANALPCWKRDAREAVEWVAHMRLTFTTDDVWERLEQLRLAEGANPAAMGPVMMAAERDGFIRKTGQLAKTRLKRRHRALTEWTAA
jgi:hypothetical protein